METAERNENLFEGVLDNYIHMLKSQMKTYPVIINALSARLVTYAKKTKEFIEKYQITESDSDGKDSYSIPEHLLKPFNLLLQETDQSALALNLIPRNIIVAFVSIYDSFVGDLVRTIYKVKPEILNASNKEISITQILQAESIETLKQQIIDKEAETILRDSHSQQLKSLEGKLKIKLTSDIQSLRHFVEITERRNLYVHANGNVSSQYLTIVDPEVFKNKDLFKDGKVPELGSDLEVYPQYVKHAFGILFEIGVKLCQVVWRTIEKDKCLEEADDALTDIVYDLLKEKNFELAITISDFSTQKYVKSYNKESEIVKLINMALAYYLNGNKDKCRKIIEEQDWSASNITYKLAVSVLQENYADSYKYMREIGPNNKMNSSYREWPLFSVIREQEEFKRLFEEIYGEPYECVEIKSANWDDILRESIELRKAAKSKKRIQEESGKKSVSEGNISNTESL